MKTWLLALGFAFSIALLSCAQVKALGESDFVVLRSDESVRLMLSEPIEQILKDLGRPLSTKEKQSDQEPKFVQYIYQGLTVGFSEYDRKVALLSVTGPEFTTSRHISVGATAGQVKSAYGPVKSEWPGVVQYQLQDTSSRLAMNYLISFWTEKDVVRVIDINRVP